MDTYQEIVGFAHQAEQSLAMQRYQNAVTDYLKALELAKELANTPDAHPRLMAVLCNRIGKVYMAQGRVQQATYFFEAALRSFENGLPPDLSDSTLSLNLPPKGFSPHLSDEVFYGLTHQPAPTYSSQAAAKLSTEETDLALHIRLRLDIGNAYLRQPQEAPALAAYQAVLNDPQIDSYPLLNAYAMANAGEVYRQQRHFDKAETQLSGAIALFEAHATPVEKRHAIAISASIAREQEQFSQAIDLYQQAIYLYQQTTDLFGQGRTETGLALTYLQQAQFDTAKAHYQTALGLAQQANDQDTQWCAHEGIGRCFHHAGQLQAAIESFQQSLTLIERRQKELQTDEGKVTFIDSVKEIYDRLLTAQLDLAQQSDPQSKNRYAAALAVAERARGQALQDLMEGHNHRHQIQATLLDIFQDDIPNKPANFDQASDLPSNQTDDPAQSAPSIAVLPNLSPLSIPPSLPELPATAAQEPPSPSPLTRLVFYVLTEQTAVFVVQPDGAVTGHVAPISCDDMKDRVAKLREQISIEQASDWGDHQHSLIAEVSPQIRLEEALYTFYDELIAPVASALPSVGQILVIEPHASLWLFPFAALQTAHGQWMGDQWPLLYAASHRTLTEVRRQPPYAQPAEAKVLIVGNPTMPQLPDKTEPLSDLPGSQEEAEAIAQIMTEHQPLLLIGPEATEASVKEQAKTHNILHLATHGIAYSEDPLASFVALSPSEGEEGLLTAREISRSQSLALPLDLVVLSACETGLGKISGDGMLGLSRAFLIAGARTVIVSQWRVADSATVKLMSAFYQHYVHSRESVLALQHAMREMRAESAADVDYQHPRYWSPFVVVGAEV